MLEAFLFITILLLAWIIIIYNLLVRDKIRVRAGWSDIDVQLKRHHDLIPKLIEAVKQYAAFESATLTTITELRTRSEKSNQVGEIGDTETALGSEIKQILILAEAYPDLKANQSFLDLQHNLTNVEEHIQYARRYYNGAVRNLNTRIESFPDILIANFFKYKAANYFQADLNGE
ncbi:MAG: LemA family protein [Proteobacteria bacterium]|nr:LemA family protein [Pseudomonadota bacterium]